MKRKLLLKCYCIARGILDRHNQPYKHYSFIVQKNRIIGYGINNNGPANITLGYPSYSKIHSEVDAYFKSRQFIDPQSQFEVVNIRMIKNARLRNSCPCQCCFGFLKSLDCSRVWFSTDIGVFGSIKIND
jgi:hypothetical protein